MTPTTTTLSLHLALIIFLSSSQSNAFTTITTRLIHRDSIHPPIKPISDRAARTLQSSLARHAYISSLNDINPQGGAEIGLVEGIKHNIFYVNFTIGNPPVQQLAVMDSGSNTLWVKCLPCRPCSPAPGITLFDPAKSKSFAPIPCAPKGCNGCTVTESKEQEEYYMNGVLPLGFNRGNSFVDRLGGRFSYCIGSVVDRTYPYNLLSIGKDAYLDGNSTTLLIHNGIYYGFIANITLGGQTLNITNEIIANMSHKYGVAIDSGAELSYLYTEAFNVVKAAIGQLGSTMMLVEAPPPTSSYELCYRGTVYRTVRNFPQMGIQFKEGAELVLDNFGMFIQVDDDVFCFAFARSPTVSFVGIMAQQGYNVGYDLVAKRLHFQDIDCQVLG